MIPLKIMGLTGWSNVGSSLTAVAPVKSVGYTRPWFKCDNEVGMVTVCFGVVVRITRSHRLHIFPAFWYAV